MNVILNDAIVAVSNVTTLVEKPEQFNDVFAGAVNDTVIALLSDDSLNAYEVYLVGNGENVHVTHHLRVNRTNCELVQQHVKIKNCQNSASYSVLAAGFERLRATLQELSEVDTQ